MESMLTWDEAQVSLECQRAQLTLFFLQVSDVLIVVQKQQIKEKKKKTI